MQYGRKCRRKRAAWLRPGAALLVHKGSISGVHRSNGEGAAAAKESGAAGMRFV